MKAFGPMDAGTEEALDRLYAAPPDRFTAERDALLDESGDRRIRIAQFAAMGGRKSGLVSAKYSRANISLHVRNVVRAAEPPCL